jgi:hypothetical protein
VEVGVLNGAGALAVRGPVRVDDLGAQDREVHVAHAAVGGGVVRVAAGVQPGRARPVAARRVADRVVDQRVGHRERGRAAGLDDPAVDVGVADRQPRRGAAHEQRGAVDDLGVDGDVRGGDGARAAVGAHAARGGVGPGVPGAGEAPAERVRPARGVRGVALAGGGERADPHVEGARHGQPDHERQRQSRAEGGQPRRRPVAAPYGQSIGLLGRRPPAPLGQPGDVLGQPSRVVRLGRAHGSGSTCDEST